MFPIHILGVQILRNTFTSTYKYETSCVSEPENADIARFVQYLFDLIEHKDLERVYMILKALKR